MRAITSLQFLCLPQKTLFSSVLILNLFVQENTNQMTSKDSLLTSEAEPRDNSQNSIFFQLMEKVGVSGRYQFMTFGVWCFMVYMAGGLTLMVPFLFYQDAYICNPEMAQKACQDYVCGLPVADRAHFIPDMTIHSLANKFGNYRCEPQKSELTLVITLMYGGSLLGVIFMSICGDLLGRKTLIVINLLMMMLGILLTIFCLNLWMAGVGICLCVFGGKNNFNLCVIFMTQTSSKKYRQTFSILIHACFCAGGLFNVLWYYTIGDFQMVLIFCYGIPSLVVLGATLFFVKDTPISLINNQTAKKTLKALKFMAKVNRKQQFDYTVEDVEKFQREYKSNLQKSKSGISRKFSIIDLFRYKSLRNMTILLVVMDCTLDLQYYAPTLMLDQFKFSIFINGLVIQSSLILASLLTSLVVYRIPRKVFNCGSYCLVAICSLVLIFIWDQNKEEVTDVGANIAVLVLVFVNQFIVVGEFNIFLVYVNQLFPTQVRIIGIGFMKIFGGLSQTLAAQLISACLSSGFKIMIIFAVLAGVSATCACCLPETLGKMPAEVIQELKEQSSIENKAR